MCLLFVLCSKDQIFHFLYFLHSPQPQCYDWGVALFPKEGDARFCCIEQMTYKWFLICLDGGSWKGVGERMRHRQEWHILWTFVWYSWPPSRSPSTKDMTRKYGSGFPHSWYSASTGPSNLKLVSCILVQSEDLRARVIIRCLCVTKNVQCRSRSHLVRQGRCGCSFGEINSEYVWDKIWAIGSSPEQRSSNDVCSRVKSCGLGRECRKWCNCTAFQKGRC